MSWFTAPISYVSQVAGRATRTAGRILIPTATITTRIMTAENTELVSVQRRDYERAAPISPFDDQDAAYPPTRMPTLKSSYKVTPPVLPPASNKASSNASDDDSGYASASFDSDSSDGSDDECTTSSLDDMERDRARLRRAFRSPSPAMSDASTRCLPVSSPRPYNPDDKEDNYSMPVEKMRYAGEDSAAVAPAARHSFSVHPLEEDVEMEGVALLTPAFSRVTRAAAQGAPSSSRVPALASAVRSPAPAAVATTLVHATGHAVTTTRPRAAVARTRPRYPIPPPTTGKRAHVVEEEQTLFKKARVGGRVKPRQQERRTAGRSKGRYAAHVEEDAMQVDEQKFEEVTAPVQTVFNTSSSSSSADTPIARDNSFAGKNSDNGAPIKTLEILSSENGMLLKVADEHGGERTRHRGTLAQVNAPRLVLTDTVFAPHLSYLAQTGELSSVRELYIRVSSPSIPSPLWTFDAKVPALVLPNLERVVLLAAEPDARVYPSVPWDRVVHVLGSVVARCPSRKPDVEMRSVTVEGRKKHVEELSAVGNFLG
ncbi:hypothetical protein EXIGLDRAFT_745796 [Exidia glandulosa HHB12029]|uniref:Uncharacterized protein n=1 Tax=Exidia glandulosa HHB12029 TaxID=1314781 RepID=A0A165N3X6_EXIGL|nr:hypothetical protein EXIGLDRAFT_745796 [Exidia glandulosa HHB12029]